MSTRWEFPCSAAQEKPQSGDPGECVIALQREGERPGLAQASQGPCRPWPLRPNMPLRPDVPTWVSRRCRGETMGKIGSNDRVGRCNPRGRNRRDGRVRSHSSAFVFALASTSVSAVSQPLIEASKRTRHRTVPWTKHCARRGGCGFDGSGPARSRARGVEARGRWAQYRGHRSKIPTTGRTTRCGRSRVERRVLHSVRRRPTQGLYAARVRGWCWRWP
ncbi:hypothetical protein BD414DRAFT_488679 [Trametes punicea]|nr:hypothetical protein BD414DRAFT_488679 [Trametes punicea]